MDSPVTVGFCFGGSNSWYQAANGHGLSGVIGLYGHPGRDFPPGAESVIDQIGSMECPVLALQSGIDQGIPTDLVNEFDAALTQGGVAHSVVIYPDAPHSFFDRSQEDHAEDSADAWRRILTFIAANS